MLYLPINSKLLIIIINDMKQTIKKVTKSNIGKLFNKIKRSNRRKRNLKIRERNIKIATVASVASLPSYIDSNGMCYTITLQQEMYQIPESFFDSFYKAKLPSFQSFKTGKITLTSEDFHSLIKSHHSYINDVSQITGKSYDQVMLDFAQYHNTREFLIQPNGFSGVVHKISNGIYISSAAIQSAVASGTSHVCGVQGMSLLASAPSLAIFVPLVGGIFFASLERLAADTPAQPVLVLARDACLITPKIAEIAYNEIFIGPVLRKLGIDAPLNVTSMLRFGTGTKRIFGGILNCTIASIADASPNLIR